MASQVANPVGRPFTIKADLWYLGNLPFLVRQVRDWVTSSHRHSQLYLPSGILWQAAPNNPVQNYPVHFKNLAVKKRISCLGVYFFPVILLVRSMRIPFFYGRLFLPLYLPVGVGCLCVVCAIAPVPLVWATAACGKSEKDTWDWMYKRLANHWVWQ